SPNCFWPITLMVDCAVVSSNIELAARSVALAQSSLYTAAMSSALLLVPRGKYPSRVLLPEVEWVSEEHSSRSVKFPLAFDATWLRNLFSMLFESAHPMA